MKQTIAIPMTEGVLSGHFGHCEQFYFAEVEEKKIVTERIQTPPEHEPGLYPKWVKEQGGTLVIAGGMGHKACDLFAQQGVEVIVGAPHDVPRHIAEAYLAGILETSSNSCDH